MATFLGIHDLGGSIEDEKFQANWAAYKKACDELGCSATHVHVNTDKGRAFCITEASDIGQVQKAHDKVQVPVVEIIEVSNLD
jgi:hypothetical protein